MAHAGAACDRCDELVLSRVEQLDARKRPGAERTPERELVAVDGHGRVGSRAAEPVALCSRLVRERPRVDDKGLTVEPQLERERVRVGVRREIGRRWRAAVERKPDPGRAEDGVAGVRVDGKAFARRREVEHRSEVEAAVVEERRRSVGTGQPGREAAHPLDRAREAGDVGGGRDLEQVAQDDEVVDGTALVVAAVGEDLDGQLALEQLHPSLEHRRHAERGAAEHERAGVADHVVAEHVVLHVAPEHDKLAPEALANGRRLQFRHERERGDPVSGPRRGRVRVPRIVGSGLVAVDPVRQQATRARRVAGASSSEHVLPVVGMEAAQALRA